MKKVLLFSLLFFIGINTTFASTETAHSYILMDQDTGRVIESKNKDTPMLIASITNIMTT
jgi:D-alanyl-D-alanine carboxypeptidase